MLLYENNNNQRQLLEENTSSAIPIKFHPVPPTPENAAYGLPLMAIFSGRLSSIFTLGLQEH